MFKKVVNVVEVLALVAALGFVVALFANGSGSSGSAGTTSGPRTGAAIYQASCAVCHGQQGQGGVGPELGGGAVVEAFPDEADQIAVVTNGRGAMPSFRSTLSPDEIRAVVDYTREDLG
jgi:mono/diheme cytochrome c family protein